MVLPEWCLQTLAHIIYKKIGKSRSIKVLDKDFFAKCLKSSSPDRGVWSLQSRNHFFSAIYRRQEL
ncbi:MAG TPA: hypothetical protein VGA86_08600, partial [Desulfatiglandales bacterium]